MNHPDTAGFNDDNIDAIAEQVARSAANLTPVELDQVFTRARRLIRAGQRQVQEHTALVEAQQDESRFNRMMDE